VHRYAAFLRAVNLGSTRKASSADLRACFEELGFDDVATFRNSGNVVFAASGGSAAELGTLIEHGLAESLGFEVPVYLRSERHMRAIAAHDPFPPRAVAASKGKLQVALLRGEPPAAARRRVMALASELDRLSIAGAELYWLPSGGTQVSSLDTRAIERALGPYTLRTRGTIEQMARKFFGG
jgi:uncharacterized protein (DUF1697 family)